MMRSVQLSVMLLSIGALCVACTSRDRRFVSDAGTRLDAGLGGDGSPSVDGSSTLDATPVDAPPVLRGEGEACGADTECQTELECRSGVCAAVGGIDEPCTRAGTCDPDLMCDGTTCRETVSVRLCHCIYTSATMSSRQLEMQVGSTLIGPTSTDVCSPCTPVPVGMDVPFEIRDSVDGRLYESGTLDLTGDPPVLTIVFSAGTLEALPGHCDPASGFCG